MRWLFQFILLTVVLLAMEWAQGQALVGNLVRLKPSSIPTRCNTGDLRVDTDDSNKLKICVLNSWSAIAGGADATSLEGRALSSAAPNASDVIMWNDGTSTWEPTALPTNSATATALAANPADCAANTYAQTIAANGDLTCASISNASTTATASNNNSTIVLRDGSGNFAASTITASLTGNVTGNVTGAITGNADTATALAANPSDCGADTYATTIAASGNLTCGTVTSAGLAGSIDATKIGDGSVTSTEFQRLDATSSVQGQFDAKASTSLSNMQSGNTAAMLALTGTSGQVFFNTTYKHRFTWSNDRWFPEGQPDPRLGSVFHEEFNTGVGGWTFTNASNYTTPPAGRFGIITEGIGTATTFCRIQQNVAGVQLSAGHDMYMESSVNVPTLATVAQDFSTAYGLNDMTVYDAESDATDGVYFLYNRATSLNWIAVSKKAGVDTSTITSVPVTAGQWYRLAIMISGVTDAKYYIDGTLVATHTTAQIPGAGEYTGVGFYFNKVTAATALAWLVDYHTMWQFFPAAR
jgi:hypothetical protein